MTEIVRCPLRTIALVSLLLGIGLASPSARADQRVGVDSAVNPNAMGIPPGGLPRRLVLGQDVVFNERITTEAEGQTQILFVDESTLSVGPNANMVIDQFVYDPNTGTGKLAASLTRGVFRFVGGKLSKQENAVTMRTPTATIGIRGGVFLVKLRSDCTASGSRLGATGCDALEVIFVYGKGVTVTGLNGVSQTITRPGFAVTVSGPGASPSNPSQSPRGSTAALLAQLDGRAGGNGGATTVPTEVTVANSGIANTISANITPNIQTVGQAAATQPQSVATTVQQTVPPTTIQAGSLQGGPATATPVNPISSITPTTQVIPPTTQATPPTTQVVITSTSPIQPQPVVISVAGLAKSTNGAPTPAGFIDQTANGRIPYSNATITYPPGSVPQNGTFAASIGGAGQVTLSPLTPGGTNAVTATSSTGATAAGTATMTPDGKFFYANLTSTTPGSAGTRLFVYGGVPVNQSFYAPTATNQFYAFTVYPDAALASATSPQTIPFLPSNYGGTMAVLPRNVSPLYVVTPANVQFGINNAKTNPNATAPKWLQASLAINGQGANQTSAFVVGNGTFTTSSDNGQVIASGLIRGTVLQSANGPLVQIYSHAHSVPDGNGNSLFGGNTISGFVLDQNENNINDNFVPNLATAVPFSPAYGSSGGQPAPQYAFNQPVNAAPLPSNVGVTRSALAETGYFGGIMETGGFISGATPVSYALTGTTSVQTDPVSSRVAATFKGKDPFTSAQSDVNSMVLQFGSLPASGSNYNRSTFIDNNLYGALESPNTPSQITVTTSPGHTTTMLLPLFNSTNSSSSPQLAMVTSATVPNNSWMPAGVTPCSCQYLQWGYWTGRVQTLTPTVQGFRNQFGAINTWVAGTPTPVTDINTLVAHGATGTYNGAAVGTVFNSGATYLAAGRFRQNYNFGSQTGNVYITQFDGANYSAAVRGASGSFAGTLTGAGSFGNRSGPVVGSFYGPSAAETGGRFNIYNGQPVASAKYLASGIFAGKPLP